MEVATFWHILAAGITNVLIGYVWYHPHVFGTAWMQLANITPEMAEKGKRRMPVYAILGLLSSMLIAWTMSYVGAALSVHDMQGALLGLVLYVWLGLVVPIMLSAVLWEHKPLRLYLINVFYWLAALSATVLILLF
jgi:ABC-type transporter Mla maintaining outer membrane lipid asymmetry permease subunit MlaE